MRCTCPILLRAWPLRVALAAVAGAGCTAGQDSGAYIDSVDYSGGTAAAVLVQSGVQTCANPIDGAQGYLSAAAGGELADQPYLTDTAGNFSADWGLAVADLNSDGHLDMYRPYSNSGVLLWGDGEGRFTAAESIHLPYTEANDHSAGMGAVPIEVNGDGHMDLAVSRQGRHELLINNGYGYFTDVADSSGLNVDEDALDFATSWADFDGDGDLDVFLPRYPMEDPGSDGNFPPGPPSVLLENQSGSFIDVSELLPEDTNDGYPFVGGWHDLDQDGKPDLVLANDHGLGARSNRAWQQEDGRFKDRSSTWGIDLAIDSMGLAAGDINGDGLPDLAFTGWPELEVLESHPDGWFQSAESRHIIPDDDNRQVGWGLDWVDLNNDGRLDLFVNYGHWENFPDDAGAFVNPEAQPDALFIQQPDGTFVEQAEIWGLKEEGISRSSVFADLNEDGWPDLLRTQIWGPTQLFLSQCGSATWVDVELSQEGSNSRAIGATVRATTEDRSQTAWIQAGGTNIAAGGPPRAHFGLGDACEVDLEVIWPDGENTIFKQISASQRVTIVRQD